ncbi:MAG: amidohydrolase family protein [Alphaproteobacteria bacterium]|nr:amidohydrolase family protein [Alphaproteobacteria bacterium]
MTPKVDAHHHFWKVARGDYGWLTPEKGVLYRDYGPEDLEPLLGRAGIEASVLVQAAPTEAETRFLFAEASAAPFVAGVVGWTEMEAADFEARLEILVDDGQGLLKGIRPMVQDIADPEWLLRVTLDDAFKRLASKGLVFDALVRPGQLGALLRRVAAHPELTVVIDHCAKPDIARAAFEHWATAMTELARETSAYCKLSGLVTEAGDDPSPARLQRYVEHVVDVFTPARLIWGSDWPVLNLAGNYGAWFGTAQDLLAGLSDAERGAVFGGNAIRAYGLDL